MHAERVTPAVIYRAILLAFALVVVVLVFPQVASLLLLVLLVVILSVPLAAGTTRLERLRIPRAVGAPLLLLLALGVVAGIVALLVPVFAAEGRKLVHALPSIVSSLQPGRHGSATDAGHRVQSFIHGYTSRPSRLIGPATTVGSGVAGAVTALVVVLLTSLYCAVRPDPLVRGALRLVHPRRRAQARQVMPRLARAYVGWLRGLAVGMVLLFGLTFAGLTAVGLPFAVVFATLTALAMVIPYYGALLSAIPPVLLALTISPGKAAIVVAIYAVTHLIEGNVIEPLVMARAVKLHPALVAIGVIVVERLFGGVGLLVAVPVLVTAKILVEEFWVRAMEARYRGEEDVLVGDGVAPGRRFEQVGARSPAPEG
jgi:predicted PurR-regulated permease PerM